MASTKQNYNNNCNKRRLFDQYPLHKTQTCFSQKKEILCVVFFFFLYLSLQTYFKFQKICIHVAFFFKKIVKVIWYLQKTSCILKFDILFVSETTTSFWPLLTFVTYDTKTNFYFVRCFDLELDSGNYFPLLFSHFCLWAC